MYHIIFEAPGMGVSTHHDDEDAACRHIDLLIGMSGKKNARWTMSHQGEEIRSSKPAPKVA